MADVDGADIYAKDELTRIRGRVHNMADKVQGHEIFLEAHRVEIDRTKQDVAAMRLEFAAQIAQVRADHATKMELTAFTQLASEKMSTLQKSIDKANDTLGKVAWIVITAVIAAVLGLVLVNRTAIAQSVRDLGVLPDVVMFLVK